MVDILGRGSCSQDVLYKNKEKESKKKIMQGWGDGSVTEVHALHAWGPELGSLESM